MRLIKNKSTLISTITLLLIFGTTILFGISSAEATKFKEVYGHGALVKVVDGDTIKLSVNGIIKNYRLAAIDTPETYNNRKAKKDIINCGISKDAMFALGKQSKEYVKGRYSPGDVIEYYQVGVGRYRRPIIWVYGITPNLIKYGMAKVVDYGNVVPNKIKYLKELESEAKQSNIGIWSTLECWK